MKAVLDKSRSVNGQPGTTLASLGFDWISMDDGWQRCNCSQNGADPALPTCPNCKQGGCKWHDAAGKPVVDVRKFPDMKKMVDYGHSLGLKVGSYLNNCICMEGGDPPMGKHCVGETHYQQDVDFIISTGFDGVKIDNCGASHNVTLWAELFNKTGKAIRIESCHTYHPNHGTFLHMNTTHGRPCTAVQYTISRMFSATNLSVAKRAPLESSVYAELFKCVRFCAYPYVFQRAGTPSSWPNFPVWDPATKAADAKCPMNLYRTGGDIRASFTSCIGEAYATVQYNDRPDPFSRPGCWA